MKIEKINDNKIRITLTFEELENRKISLADIEKDTSKAKELFIDLIEESNIDNDFIIDDSHLFIEACSDNNNLFIVTITKIDNIPELKKYSILESNQDTRSNSSKNVQSKIYRYKVESYIYSFDNLDTVLQLCDTAKSENLFFGRNSLYKLDETYFVIFSQATIRNKKFLKTFVFLSEYCKEYYSYDLFETSITEKAQIILKNNALQQLTKI